MSVVFTNYIAFVTFSFWVTFSEMKWKFDSEIGFIGTGLKLKLTFLMVCQAIGKLFVHTGAVILQSDSLWSALLVLLRVTELYSSIVWHMAPCGLLHVRCFRSIDLLRGRTVCSWDSSVSVVTVAMCWTRSGVRFSVWLRDFFLRSSHFWDVTQRGLVVSHRHSSY
jgi:hypothetical protein